MENAESIINDIKNGKWDTVLSGVQQLNLPNSKVWDLFEQVKDLVYIC